MLKKYFNLLFRLGLMTLTHACAFYNAVKYPNEINTGRYKIEQKNITESRKSFIRGVVKDTETDTIIPYATLSLRTTSKTFPISEIIVITDSIGQFEMELDNKFIYEMIINAERHFELRIKPLTVPKQQFLKMTVHLGHHTYICR